jgi:hypothetical protein
MALKFEKFRGRHRIKILLYPLILRSLRSKRLEGCGPDGGLMVRDAPSALLTMRVYDT